MINGAWKLVTESGEPAIIGAEYKDFRGDVSILAGGAPPHKPSSTGRVYVKVGSGVQELYPSVIGLRWVEVA